MSALKDPYGRWSIGGKTASGEPVTWGCNKQGKDEAAGTRGAMVQVV